VKAWFQRQTLRYKVQIVILGTTTAALLLLLLFQAVLQYMELRHSTLEELRHQVDRLGDNVVWTLVTDNSLETKFLLQDFGASPKILGCQVFTQDGELFASYGQSLSHEPQHSMQQASDYLYRFYINHLCIHRPLFQQDKELGVLMVQVSLLDLQTAMAQFFMTWGFIIVVAWLLSYLLSRKFRKVISAPLERLALAMQTVTEENAYNLRINDAGNDELGQLTAGFNEMLEQIELRDSELILHRDRLEHMAHHDSLTGLPNRLLFNDRLKQAIQRAERSKRPIALIFIDLDRFKIINDTLGHDVGDLVLVEAASRLEAALRRSDTVARLGGDEFVVILEEFESQQSVAQISRKIIDELSQECQIMDHSLYVTASLGISFYPDNGTDLTSLKRCADIAMFRAKESGRDNFQFYLPGMGDGAKKTLTLESDLRCALEENQLRLYFQPQISMKSGQVCSAEALLRWEHPQRGLVLPGEFIPLAEETGLIVSLGEWALRETCRLGSTWLDKGLGPIQFSVNVSPRQFRQPNLVEMVIAVLEETGLPAHMLELEVTENLLMGDVEDAIRKMIELRRLGVLLAIDDFGSGYSSLSYLKHFPITKLKIDRSFIRDLHENRHDLAIAASVASMAEVMGLVALAEGVEIKAQEAALIGLGLEWAQGFLYQVPLPEDQFEAFLQQAELNFCVTQGEPLPVVPLSERIKPSDD